MPRSDWALQVAEATDVWARTGDVLAPESAPTIDRAEGWAADFAVDGGRKPSRQRFNWLERVAFENLRDQVIYGGALPYRDDLDFLEDAVVTHSGDLYIALADNGPGSTVTEPGTDDAVWREVGSDAGFTGTLGINQGGTGATTAAGARSALDAAATTHMHTDYATTGHTHALPSLPSLSGTLGIDQGGTGATTAAGARSALDAAVSSHLHDGRYYTEAEADARFAHPIVDWSSGDGGQALWNALDAVFSSMNTDDAVATLGIIRPTASTDNWDNDPVVAVQRTATEYRIVSRHRFATTGLRVGVTSTGTLTYYTGTPSDADNTQNFSPERVVILWADI